MKALFLLGVVLLAAKSCAASDDFSVAASAEDAVTQSTAVYETFMQATYNGTRIAIVYHFYTVPITLFQNRNLQPVWLQELLPSDCEKLCSKICWICNRRLWRMDGECCHHC